MINYSNFNHITLDYLYKYYYYSINLILINHINHFNYITNHFIIDQINFTAPPLHHAMLS